jgi:hypothetical protein
VDLSPLLKALHLDSTATWTQIADALNLVLVEIPPVAPFAGVIHTAIVHGGPMIGLAILTALGVNPASLSHTAQAVLASV